MAFDDPKEYMRWYAENEAVYREELQLIKAMRLSNCLDVGSGPSVFHEGIEGSAISVDLSYAMLSAGNADEDRIQGSALSLPFRDSCVDCVSSFASVMFFKDPALFLREAWRVLKPGGTLALCAIPSDSQLGRLYSEMGKRGDKYYREAVFYTKQELISAVAGLFEVEEVRAALPEGSFYCVKARKARDPYNRLP
ncbi:class I SAM-dependent methyltransferase [Tardisphaera miroshnichenkoae]